MSGQILKKRKTFAAMMEAQCTDKIGSSQLYMLHFLSHLWANSGSFQRLRASCVVHASAFLVKFHAIDLDAVGLLYPAHWILIIDRVSRSDALDEISLGSGGVKAGCHIGSEE